MTLTSSLTANLSCRSSPGQQSDHHGPKFTMTLEEVNERFVWIKAGTQVVGLIDRAGTILEWIAPHPGLPSFRPAQIPAVYHAPSYQGGRIVLQWWLSNGCAWRPHAGQGFPEPVGMMQGRQELIRPRSTTALETREGKSVSLKVGHAFPRDDRVRSGHRIEIYYDPQVNSFVAEVTAEMTAPDPYVAEVCNLYAGGVYDNRPRTKRYQQTVWRHPDGNLIRWPHNPVSYLTPGMNDAQGERRIACPGWIGYFGDSFSNPVVEILESTHELSAATCCNLYDEHLICLAPRNCKPDGTYQWRCRYRFFSVHPDLTDGLVAQSRNVAYGIDPAHRDPILNEPGRTDLDLSTQVIYNPRFPGFYYNQINGFEDSVPLEQTQVASMIWASHCPEHEVYWASDCGHGGCRSIRLHGRSPEQTVRTRVAGGPTPHVNPNQRFRLSGWIRCQGVNAGGAAIRFDEIGMKANPPKVSHLAGPVWGDTDWTYVEAVFTSQPDADLGWLYLELKGSGQAWFDDVALEEA